MKTPISHKGPTIPQSMHFFNDKEISYICTHVLHFFNRPLVEKMAALQNGLCRSQILELKLCKWPVGPTEIIKQISHWLLPSLSCCIGQSRPLWTYDRLITMNPYYKQLCLSFELLICQLMIVCLSSRSTESWPNNLSWVHLWNWNILLSHFQSSGLYVVNEEYLEIVIQAVNENQRKSPQRLPPSLLTKAVKICVRLGIKKILK